jgi:hypothetical protein
MTAQAQVAVLTSISQRMQAVIDGATELIESARDNGIDEIQRQADTVREQLLSARKRVHLLAQRLSSAG